MKGFVVQQAKLTRAVENLIKSQNPQNQPKPPPTRTKWTCHKCGTHHLNENAFADSEGVAHCRKCKTARKYQKAEGEQNQRPKTGTTGPKNGGVSSGESSQLQSGGAQSAQIQEVNFSLPSADQHVTNIMTSLGIQKPATTTQSAQGPGPMETDGGITENQWKPMGANGSPMDGVGQL